MQPEINVFGLSIKTFGLFFALNFVAWGALVGRRLRELGKPVDWAYEMVAAALVGGLIGARGYWLVQNHESFSLGNVLGGSGLVWYGGLAGGVVFVLLWARWRGFLSLALLDMAGPGLALGYAIGRIGCQVSGDGDYGRAWDGPWAMGYPHGTVPTAPGVTVHPTPIYETLVMGLVAYVLWQLRDRVRPGVLFALYLVIAGARALPDRVHPPQRRRGPGAHRGPAREPEPVRRSAPSGSSVVGRRGGLLRDDAPGARRACRRPELGAARAGRDRRGGGGAAAGGRRIGLRRRSRPAARRRTGCGGACASAGGVGRRSGLRRRRRRSAGRDRASGVASAGGVVVWSGPGRRAAAWRRPAASGCRGRGLGRRGRVGRARTAAGVGSVVGRRGRRSTGGPAGVSPSTGLAGVSPVAGVVSAGGASSARVASASAVRPEGPGRLAADACTGVSAAAAATSGVEAAGTGGRGGRDRRRAVAGKLGSGDARGPTGATGRVWVGAGVEPVPGASRPSGPAPRRAPAGRCRQAGRRAVGRPGRPIAGAPPIVVGCAAKDGRPAGCEAGCGGASWLTGVREPARWARRRGRAGCRCAAARGRCRSVRKP